MNWILQLQIIGEIGLSAFLAGLIGFEREVADKPAGLRTHMLVGASATLLVALGNFVVSEFDFPEFVQTDPIRIIEAIIVGISFLGAGTILQREREGRVEGLTTSASLLAVAAIGISVALRLFVLSIATTVLILIVNRALNWFGIWLNKRVNGGD